MNVKICDFGAKFGNGLIRRLVVTVPRQMMMMAPVFLIIGIIRKNCPAPDWEE